MDTEMQLVAISCNQLQSVAISCNQWQSVVISGNQWHTGGVPDGRRVEQILIPALVPERHEALVLLEAALRVYGIPDGFGNWSLMSLRLHPRWIWQLVTDESQIAPPMDLAIGH
jgi:hypothetical protein